MNPERAENRALLQKILPKEVSYRIALARTSLTLLLAPAGAITAQTIFDSFVPNSHFAAVAEAQPNLAVQCRNISILGTVRDYDETNGKPNRQEGEDKDGPPVKGAKVQFKVGGKNIGDPIKTDGEGKAFQRFPEQPCNSDDGKGLLVQVEITPPDGRFDVRNPRPLRNGYNETFNLWVETKKPAGSATPTATATRPATSPTPDTRPAVSPAPATAPAVSPASVPGLSVQIDNLVKDVIALVDGVKKIDQAWAEGGMSRVNAEAKYKDLEARYEQLKKSSGESNAELEARKKELEGQLADARKKLAEAEQKLTGQKPPGEEGKEKPPATGQESEQEQQTGGSGGLIFWLLGTSALGVVGWLVGPKIFGRLRRQRPQPAPAQGAGPAGGGQPPPQP